MRSIATGDDTKLQDHRLYPGCRLVLTCAACTWSKSYNPDRVIRRLQQLGVSGHQARLKEVAGRVGWDCPGCRRTRWRAGFAWPEGMTTSEIRRLANLYRN